MESSTSKETEILNNLEKKIQVTYHSIFYYKVDKNE